MKIHKYYNIITTSRILWIIVAAAPFYWLREGYFSGGDNGQLAYMFPGQIIENQLFNLVVNNTPGSHGDFQQQLYQLPLLCVIWMLKALTFEKVNIQALMFSINLMLAYHGFYRLIEEIIGPSNYKNRIIYAAGAVAYCCSIFLLAHAWRHALFNIYLLSFLPITAMLHLRTVNQRNSSYLYVNATISGVYSVALFSIPWLAGFILCLLPYLIYLVIKDIRHLIYILKYIGLSMVINMYWIAYFIWSLVGNRSIGVGPVSQGEFARTISEVTHENNLAYPLLAQSMPRWIEGLYTNKVDSIIIIISGLIISLLIFIALLNRQIPSSKRRTVSIFLICWLVSIYLYCIKITAFGLPIFISLPDINSSFLMFRNNFDKFSIGIAFCTALLFAVSVIPLWDNLVTKRSTKNKNFLLGAIYIIIFTNIYTLYAFNYYSQKLTKSNSSYRIINEFNIDYLTLVDDLKSDNYNGKFLWLPLNNASYVIIGDRLKSDSYYAGPSPLGILTQKLDFTGRFSFTNYAFGEQLMEAFNEHDLEVINKYLDDYNIRYIIVNYDIPDNGRNSWLYGGLNANDQISWLLPTISAQLIKKYGNRYAVYEIPRRLKNEILYVDPGKSSADTPSINIKEYDNKHKYNITLCNSNSNMLVVFKEAQASGWVMTGDAVQSRKITKVVSPANLNYWLVYPAVSSDAVEDAGCSEYNIEFTPNAYLKYLEIFSLFMFGSCLFQIFKRRIQVRSTTLTKYNKGAEDV